MGSCYSHLDGLGSVPPEQVAPPNKWKGSLQDFANKPLKQQGGTIIIPKMQFRPGQPASIAGPIESRLVRNELADKGNEDVFVSIKGESYEPQPPPPPSTPLLPAFCAPANMATMICTATCPTGEASTKTEPFTSEHDVEPVGAAPTPNVGGASGRAPPPPLTEISM